MTKIKSFAHLFSLLLGLFIFQFPGNGFSAQVKSGAAPSFTLNLLNGGVLNSSDLNAKVTVLKFVASY